jgi:AcrR family transcriptional regulator
MDEVASRRKYAKGLEVQDHIVGVALQRFAELGYGGCSIMDLAAAAQVSKNQLFHHFGSKENIALACVERVRREWQNEVATPAQIYPEPAAQLDFILTKLAERLESGWPGLHMLASMAASSGSVPGAVTKAMGSVLDEIQQQLRGIIKEGRRSGAVFPGVKARVMADYIISVLLGAAVLGAAEAGRGVGAISTLRSQLLGSKPV